MACTDAIPGFASQLYVGTNRDKIGSMKDVTISVERDTIDVSSHSAAGWKDVILGLAQWTASSDYLYIQDDVAQNALYDALINRTEVEFRFVPDTATPVLGDDKYEGTGIITSWETAGPQDDAVATSVEVMGCGALTKGSLTQNEIDTEL